jgi:hypothetical protein
MPKTRPSGESIGISKLSRAQPCAQNSLDFHLSTLFNTFKRAKSHRIGVVCKRNYLREEGSDSL